jgi:hypothetical protein
MKSKTHEYLKLKKQFMIIGLGLLTFGTTVKAQSDEPRTDFTFGVKAGVNYSNVWDEQGQDFRADAKAGFAGGVFVGIPFGKFIGFQPELLISQKGFQGSGTLFATPYSFERTTTFIDVPLFLQVKPADVLTLVLGPQFSYLVHQKDVYTFGTNSVEQEQDFKNENVRKNILGFAIGADINLSHFVLSGRLGWDFQNNRGDGTSSTPRYKNQWLQLTAGYKF